MAEKFRLILDSIKSLIPYSGGEPILLYEFTTKVDTIMPNLRPFSEDDQALFLKYIVDRITGDAKRTLRLLQMQNVSTTSFTWTFGFHAEA